MCEKIFFVIYLLSKEEIALSKLISLLFLFESFGLEDIKYFSTRSTFVVRNIAMELSEVIKSDLIKKTEKSEAFAVLTDEAMDISNILQVLTFIKYHDSEKKCYRYLFCKYL